MLGLPFGILAIHESSQCLQDMHQLHMQLVFLNIIILLHSSNYESNISAIPANNCQFQTRATVYTGPHTYQTSRAVRGRG